MWGREIAPLFPRVSTVILKTMFLSYQRESYGQFVFSSRRESFYIEKEWILLFVYKTILNNATSLFFY